MVMVEAKEQRRMSLHRGMQAKARIPRGRSREAREVGANNAAGGLGQ